MYSEKLRGQECKTHKWVQTAGVRMEVCVAQCSPGVPFVKRANKLTASETSVATFPARLLQPKEIYD